MSDGVLSTSGSSFSAQILSTQHQVSALKKSQDIQEQEGDAKLKLLDSVPTANPRPDPSSPIGYNVNIKA